MAIESMLFLLDETAESDSFSWNRIAIYKQIEEILDWKTSCSSELWVSIEKKWKYDYTIKKLSYMEASYKIELNSYSTSQEIAIVKESIEWIHKDDGNNIFLWNCV